MNLGYFLGMGCIGVPIAPEEQRLFGAREGNKDKSLPLCKMLLFGCLAETRRKTAEKPSLQVQDFVSPFETATRISEAESKSELSTTCLQMAGRSTAFDAAGETKSNCACAPSRAQTQS